MQFIVATGWILVSLLIVSAPLLANLEQHTASSALYFIFSRVCHQEPARSFSIFGLPFAVCHRCFGIYLGFVAGSLLRNPFGSFSIRRIWIFAAAVPLLIDVALPFLGFVNNTPISRFLTGHLFGIMLATVFLQGILELEHRATEQRLIYRGDVL